MCRYLSLFLSYIKIKIGKNRSMLNVRLAGDHLYGKWLFTWQSLVMSLVASFCAVLFTVYAAPWAEIIIFDTVDTVKRSQTQRELVSLKGYE